MNAHTKPPAKPQDASLYLPTDITPEKLFQAIGRLRKEARDEIDRLIRFLDDTDKFDAMAAADLLVMPSYYESLSMVALEAWALGRAVLANGKCDVLKGQCIRSNAGLYYETYGEFIGTLEAIEQNRWLAGTLGRNGRQFFRDNYDWPVIERKYLEMFERLKKETPPATPDSLPGWSDRRRQDLPAAQDVLSSLPTGPAGRRA